MSERGVTRRTFLRGAGAAGVAVAGGRLWATAPAAAQARRVTAVDTPIEHLVIACQENRSFDHYYGYAAQVQIAGYGPPAGSTTRSSSAILVRRIRRTPGARCTGSGTAAPWTGFGRSHRV
jgi:FtsP/CotA-like multicopper oxidase with cupredoxin domain